MNTSEKYPLQIMNIGMFRGGTASLSLALKELGFGSTWHLVTNSVEFNDKGFKWWFDNAIFDKLLNDDADNIDFDQWLQIIKCKVIMDSPIFECWPKIFKQYPKCKVIICVRDFDLWYKSYINFLTQNMSQTFTICTMTDKVTKMLLKLWDKRHVGTDHFGMSQLLHLEKSKRKQILKKEYYDKWIQDAKRIVPKDQLLIFNPCDGWKPLCKFLNKQIPNKAYPNINNRKQYNQFMYQWKKKALKGLLKDKICNWYILFALFGFVISYIAVCVVR